MPGELARDEPIDSGEESFKCNVFIPVLDTVIVQLEDRFSNHETELMKEMQIFAPSSLLTSERALVANDIRHLCENYCLDAADVLKELAEFRSGYRQVHHMVNMGDMMPDPSNTSQGRDITKRTTTEHKDHEESYTDKTPTESTGEQGEEEENEEEQTITTAIRWIEHSFTKPLRVLCELSGFNSLSCMYTNLASCSAERAMSRVQIVKDRLRSTMVDDWFSALLVLSTEKDLLDSLIESDIIDKFVRCSLPLQKLLMHGFHE